MSMLAIWQPYDKYKEKAGGEGVEEKSELEGHNLVAGSW